MQPRSLPGAALVAGFLVAVVTAAGTPASAQEGPAVQAVPVIDVEVAPLDAAAPAAPGSGARRERREAWAVHCYQGAEEVLSLAPLYRVLEVRDNIQDWYYETEDGTRFAGRVGTNVNCYFERLGRDGQRLASFLPETLTQPVAGEEAAADAEEGERARLASVPPADEGTRLQVGLGGERSALGTLDEAADDASPRAEAAPPSYTAPPTRAEDRPLGGTESVLDRPQTLLAIEGLGALPPGTTGAPDGAAARAEPARPAAGPGSGRGPTGGPNVGAAAAVAPARTVGLPDQPVARRDLRDPRMAPIPVEPPRAWLAAEDDLWVQLAAMPSEASARAEWRRLRLRHGATVARLAPVVGRGERIGGEPVWRIRLQPGDRRQAVDVCRTVRQDGGLCRLPREWRDLPALASAMPQRLAPPDLDRPIGLPDGAAVAAAPPASAPDAPEASVGADGADLPLSLDRTTLPAEVADAAVADLPAAADHTGLDAIAPAAGGDAGVPPPSAASDAVAERPAIAPDRPTLDRDVAISVAGVVPTTFHDRGLAWEQPVLRTDVAALDELVLSASGSAAPMLPAETPVSQPAAGGLAIRASPPTLAPQGETTAGMTAAHSAAGELVQLAAHRDQAAALATWGALSIRHPALAGHDPLISRADLGIDGVWYRLQVALPGRADAEGLCQAIRRQGGDCWLVQGR